jgi:hypothetical protein
MTLKFISDDECKEGADLMPVQNRLIPAPGKPILIRLHYLDVHLGPTMHRGPLSYLHLVRCDPGVAPDLAELKAKYLARLNVWVEEARELLRGLRADLVIRPPSSRNDAEPYLAAILRDHPAATDASRYLERERDVRAGRDASVEDVMGSWRLQEIPGLARYSDLLVVDDVFAKGTTVAALVTVLRAAGLPAPEPVNVFVPLWVQPLPTYSLEGIEPFP